MSTLTKVLIVLLSFGAIFLCGAALTFVSNTNKEIDELETQASNLDTVSAELLSTKQQLNTAQKAYEENAATLQAQITQLQKENDMLSVDKSTAETKSREYQSKYSNLAASLENLENTIGNLQTLLASTQRQLEETRADSIRNKKYLNETTEELMAKTVRLESLEARLKQTLEEKQALEEQLSGEQVAVATVTPTPNQTAVPSAEVNTTQPIRGVVTEVQQSLVGISVGAADGVKKDQTFHVTRGDQFICDVVITDVDTNKAAGVLKMVQQRPRVGDNVTTRL